MNQERCMKQADSPGRSCLRSGDFPAEPWHSTPVKKCSSSCEASQLQDVTPEAVASERDSMVRQGHDLQHSTSLPLTREGQMPACDVENSTLLRQRQELQLLMAELKDRDQELNNMATAHHSQLLAWQQDRQRVLLLEERCARLEEEVKQQHELLRAVSRRAKTSEAQEKSSQRELDATQQQLQDLRHTHRHSSLLQHELEDRNQALNSTVTLLSSQVGQLQAREEELSTMLQLKDKDVEEAIAHIQQLSGRVARLQDSRVALRSRESKMLAELEQLKRSYRDARHQNSKLKEELKEKTLENSTQREEVIRLKQEAQLLRRDLLISGEGESWKDEMLELCRSKQERTEAELHDLRMVCASQHNDLQLLTLNLESAQEALWQHQGQRSHDSTQEALRRSDSAQEALWQHQGQRSRDSQGEETRSPQPASPILWTSVSPVGPSRTIYHSSPTSSNYEVNVTSTQRLQEVNVSPTQRLQEVNVSSTQRLQRLLEESRQMVATLEGLSLDSRSPSPHHTHSHSPSPSHHSSHSPAQNNHTAQPLNGHHDNSDIQDGGSGAQSLSSASKPNNQMRKIPSHLSKTDSSRLAGETSQ